MNLLFMGTPDFARVVLESLFKDSRFFIAGVVTQEDKPFGRNKELKASPCKIFAEENNIKIFQPKNLDEIYGEIVSLNIDVIVVVAFGKILPKEFILNYLCLNLHGSILPYSRGASPIQDMILSEVEFVGISVIKMDEKLDNGDIMALCFMKNENLDIETLSELLSKNGAKLLIKTLLNLNNIAPLAQFGGDSSYCKKIKKSDGEIEFKDARRVYLKYLAYKNWPQIFLNNGTKIFGIEICETDSNNRAGEILEILESSAIIGCKKGSLKIREIQASGKNRMNIVSYLRGKRLKIGDILK